ncbi:unnamed protein product [Hyaloperonospora brassicae]|nr:unnamed protein product [Hyaloperonospora brassicae]
MKCPDVLTALRMGRRNAHGVPPLKVVSMYLRWEEDTRAHSFTPQFEHGLLSANPVSDGDVGNLIYVGLFLDEKSRTELAARIPAAHVNKYADHVTLFYQPNLQYVRDVELSALGSVRGVEVVQDDRGQALRVEVDRNLHLQRRNKIPHVTLSTAHRVKPVYSNDLLSISSAKRAAVDPPLDLKARVGAVFSVEEEQVVTTTSPFAVDDSAYDSSRTHRDVDNDVSPQRSNAAKSKLFILHVRECDFAKDTGETRTKLRGMAQVLYQMGSGCKARLLCIRKSQTSPLSVSALMKRVQSRFLLSATQSFDDVVSFCEPVSSNAFDETICKYLDTANFGLYKQVTILTTDAEVLQRPLSEVRCFQDSALSVSWIGQECAVSRDKRMLEFPCTSMSAMLDSLGINVEERTRSVILRGISAIEEAWTRVSAVKGDGALHRIDTTIMSMSSPVIGLCLVLPSGTSFSEEATLQEKLLSELRGACSVRHVVCDSSVPDRFYFSLCTASSYTPVFCVQMSSPSKDCGGAVDKSAAVQLECWQHQLQASRELCDTEPYSVMTVLVRAILSSRCSSLLPSECQLSSLVNLISEHLVLHYFKSIESCGEVDAVPSAADVASGRIIYSLYRMLTYLSKVNVDEWPAIFGAPLQTLQGDQRAQAAWSRAMEDVMQSCSAVMVKYPRVAQGLSRATRLNLSDHLEAISALIEPRVDPTYSASSVRAAAIVSSHVEWSLVHSLALCDKLRHAAALRVTRADNDDRSTEEDDPARRVFFSCAPSVVARRIDVTTSSLEILRDVMTKTGDASKAAERDVAHDATSCHVESEDDGAWDLNQSRIDMQWEVDAPDGRSDVVD